MIENKMKKAFVAALLVIICTAPLWSQSAGAKVQGTVKDNGKPIVGAEVVITNSDSSATYKSKTDENGVFEIAGVPTGNNYKLEVINSAGLKVFVSQQLSFDAEAGAPAVLAIDTSDVSKTNLSAANAQHHYSREEIAALRAQNAKAQQQNTLITQALNAINAKQWKEAVPPLQQLIANDPDRYEFYQSLGDAQMNLAHYDEAIQAYERGVQLVSSSPADPRNPANDPVKRKSRAVAMLANEGTCFLKLGKTDDAVAAFRRAATLDPASGVAQFNLCATLYNTHKIDAAVAACDKSIGLEPNRPETYFMKANLLLARANRDKNTRDQTAAAALLKKYLELAPEGPLAPQAKELLTQIAAAAPKNQGSTK